MTGYSLLCLLEFDVGAIMKKPIEAIVPFLDFSKSTSAELPEGLSPSNACWVTG